MNKTDLAQKLAFGTLVAGGIASVIAYLPPPENPATRTLPFKVVGVLTIVTLVLSIAAAVVQRQSGEPMTKLVRLALGVGLFFFLLFTFFAVFVVDLSRLF